VHIVDREAPITIEDNVWLAHGAIIGPGVRIGQGSIVAAGSVIRRDIPPDSLAIGNPARVLHLDLLDR
jgi:maltose O-acetyltransferase